MGETIAAWLAIGITAAHFALFVERRSHIVPKPISPIERVLGTIRMWAGLVLGIFILMAH